MKDVLYICEGNVGRSQMAEGFHNNITGQKSAISAGIADVGAKYNYVPRADIIQVMQEKGIDISDQRIKLLTEEMLQLALIAIVLCNPELLPNFVNTGCKNVLIREVPDPEDSTIEGVRKIRDQIEQIVLSQLNS